MLLTLAGILYIAVLFAIANLYLPIAYIAIAYAIAGLAYRIANQVSLTVEKRRERRYNANMRTGTLIRGLNAVEAYTAVENGASVYCVAFQPNSARLSEYAPIGTGAWQDSAGLLYIEPCFLSTARETALNLAIAEKQQCILQVEPDGDSRLYLMQDTPANRGLALLNAGGYTAIDGFLLVYSEKHIPHFLIDGQVQVLPCRGTFLSITE